MYMYSTWRRLRVEHYELFVWIGGTCLLYLTLWLWNFVDCAFAKGDDDLQWLTFDASIIICEIGCITTPLLRQAR